MIYDRIENFGIYMAIDSGMADILRFIEEKSLSERKDGRYEINSSGAFVIIESYDTLDISDCFIECHRKYIDVQVLISGYESVGVCHKVNCQDGVYDEEKDYEKLEGAGDLLCFDEGSFMVFFPEDGHMPKIMDDVKPVRVRKAVFKLPIAEGVK
ncbi:MAG: YhcH/YjgK/YiaL family protein [Nitrospira sp.]|nr:YhcH/YjgK/YiaL family protein [bacterium]MBL7048527.1 YhcH/YjgK/YiaL family protein [Nitrospira sp.]